MDLLQEDSKKVLVPGPQNPKPSTPNPKRRQRQEGPATSARYFRHAAVLKVPRKEGLGVKEGPLGIHYLKWEPTLKRCGGQIC